MFSHINCLVKYSYIIAKFINNKCNGRDKILGCNNNMADK